MSLLTARGGRGLVAVLLLLATAVFAVGVSIEKAEEREHAEPAAATARAEGGHEDEALFGVETESTPLVVLGVVLSLGAVAAVWWFGDRRWVLGLVALFCLGFAVLDGIEAARKLGDEATIAALALLALLLHLAVGAQAGRLARRSEDLSPG